MSLTAALDAAVSSLGTLNRAINLTSENVANANNQNYNVQEAIFADLEAGGVQISQVRRQVNDSLRNQLLNEVSLAAGSKVRDDAYVELEQFIGTIAGETPLVDMFDDFRNAWKAFEAAPESNAARTDVVLRAQTMISEINRLSVALDTANRQLLTETDRTVDDLNNALSEISRLNARIVTEQASFRETAALESQRDAEVLKVAEIMDIQVFQREGGGIALYTKSGIDLVDRGASSFTWDIGTFTLTKTGSVSTNLLPDLPEGTLRSQINLIATDSASVASTQNGVATIQKLKNQLDEFAFSLVDVSMATATGDVPVAETTDITTLAGVDAGDVITINVGGSDQTVTVTGGMTAAQLVAALNGLVNVSARIDASGQVQIKSNAGDLTITDADGAAAGLGLLSGGSQTFSQASAATFARAYQQELATGSTVLTETTDLIAAAGLTDGSTFTISNGGAGATTVTIGTGAGEAQTAGDLIAALNDIEGIRARLDGSGFLEISSIGGSLTITDGANTPLADLGFTIVAGAVTVAGTPQAGEARRFFEARSLQTPDDVSRANIRVNDTLINNSEKVKQLVATDVVESLNSNDRALVGSGIDLQDKTYTGLAAGILTEISRQGEIASREATRAETLRASLFEALRNDVGVNIDEELARLTVLQNSFAATARVLSVVDDLFGTLETIVQ